MLHGPFKISNQDEFDPTWKPTAIIYICSLFTSDILNIIKEFFFAIHRVFGYINNGKQHLHVYLHTRLMKEKIEFFNYRF